MVPKPQAPEFSSLSISDDGQQEHQNEMVVIVDPYSTGCCVAQEFSKVGYKLIAVWTQGFSEEMKTHVPTTCAGLSYHAEVDEEDSLEKTAAAIKVAAGTGKSVIACIAGGEAGVDYADALSEHMGLRTNGTDIPNRRDKKLQQELIRDKGMRSVRQAGGDKFEDVEEFLRTEEYPVVVKPVESAGSDGVKLCQSYQEAKDHFHLLMKSQMVNGGGCPAVLCQEFLRGKEYVVDHVSRDGVHKTTMVWVYDKRPANGSAFVYYGCLPIESDTEEAKIVIPYIRDVLDALGVKNGPSHGEVMMTPDGPCLVEMNCRANGGDGSWRPLASALTGGYSQVDAAVWSFVDEARFAALPDVPPPFKAQGQEVELVSYSEGIVKSTPGFDVIRQLPSFSYLESPVKKGSKVEYTVDLITTPGIVILIHQDESVFKRDLEFIRYLETINGLFLYESKPEALTRPKAEVGAFPEGPSLIRHMSNDRPELRAGGLVRRQTTVDASKEVVVIVNPYTTGAWIAKEVMNRTFKVIALYTEDFQRSELKDRLPHTCDGLNFHAVVNEGDTLANTVSAVYKAAGSFRIVACFAGGEAGVILADALSERLDVRSNGTTPISNRRDKKLQQEVIKNAGLRSIKQVSGVTFEEVEEFLNTEKYPLVVKPVQSSGNHGVRLCHNFDEAKDHFHHLLNVQSKTNGEICKAVICQEFLKGKEYLIDHVSRDSIHKTVMIWMYDKRNVNSASNVYFGTIPVDSKSQEAKLLIPYVRTALKALGIKNGPSHCKVMMTPSGPCMIEMNSRSHGNDGIWKPLCNALCGYSQVEASVDASLDKQSFMALPDVPPSPFKSHGQEVTLVSFSRGTVKSTPGFDEIKEMESYVYLETVVEAGSKIEYTVDLFTNVGNVILMHRDKAVLEGDLERIRQLEKENGLFEYEGSTSGIMKSPSVLKIHGTQNVFTSDRSDLY